MKYVKAIILIANLLVFTSVNAQNSLVNEVKTALTNQCIPANTFAELSTSIAGTQTDAYGNTSVALGSYERISPDGRFVLRSFSGGRLGEVSLIELDALGAPVAAYDTPLSNEAFPVQGSWRYLVDVNGDHYSFSGIIASSNKDKGKLQPLFKGGMSGFYAAAAELPFNPALDKPGHVRIRSMSWPNPNGDGLTQGEGALVARTIEVDVQRHRITADTGNQALCGQRIGLDGPLYALPMISVDGQEFAALPQMPVNGEPTMRIFSFGAQGKSCEPRAAFTFNSGKTIFGFARTTPSLGASAASGALDASDAPQLADLAYEYRGQIWWVSRSASARTNTPAPTSKSTSKPSSAVLRFNLAPYYSNPQGSPLTELLASAFPGITQDGRIIYAAVLKTCPPVPPGGPARGCTEKSGYVTTDPYQSNAYQTYLQQLPATAIARRQCITHGDVARSRAAFASAQGLQIK